MKHDETKMLKQILTSSGKLVSDLGNMKKGKLVMQLELLHITISL